MTTVLTASRKQNFGKVNDQINRLEEISVEEVASKIE